jgi:hypothetical protein
MIYGKANAHKSLDISQATEPVVSPRFVGAKRPGQTFVEFTRRWPLL